MNNFDILNIYNKVKSNILNNDEMINKLTLYLKEHFLNTGIYEGFIYVLNNNKIFLEKEKEFYEDLYFFVDEELRNNKDLILYILKKNPIYIYYVSEKLQRDSDIIALINKENKCYFEYKNKSLKKSNNYVKS